MADSLETLLPKMVALISPQLPKIWQELIVNVEVNDQELDVVVSINTKDKNSQEILADIDNIDEIMIPIIKNLSAKQDKKGYLTEAKISISFEGVVDIELQYQNESEYI